MRTAGTNNLYWVSYALGIRCGWGLDIAALPWGGVTYIVRRTK